MYHRDSAIFKKGSECYFRVEFLINSFHVPVNTQLDVGCNKMTYKINKGFELYYWKLSYRRKIIRTLWSFPLISASILLPSEDDILGVSRITLVVLLFVVTTIIALYNYKKWQSQKNSKDVVNG